MVSIHTPALGTTCPEPEEVEKAAVSIHVPYAGNDLSQRTCCTILSRFQSMPPMQGATELEADALGS